MLRDSPSVMGTVGAFVPAVVPKAASCLGVCCCMRCVPFHMPVLQGWRRGSDQQSGLWLSTSFTDLVCLGCHQPTVGNVLLASAAEAFLKRCMLSLKGFVA